ncbi:MULTISPECIES: helix-turn-helix transcriptional regulator [Rhodococcus]|uniref:helix-turn-helix transcriptional regulator n=1 Tax=Rhodococcus TaxID=1827 RepID=UPI00193B5A57|nr:MULTISPECIES: helix-turn-helix transcriptional regulator [Rhodococcus]QRI76271.1 helix-turn-helix transcriptional regulator [Rhodococcus aetherivorans]QSE59682.1 helix-turn-helix transcriptional regulator [Rhodococcus sp. PSBB066]
MQNSDEWAQETASRIGRAVKTYRQRAGITAAQLATLTEELGFPLNRVAIAKIENGHRRGKLDVTELIVLARALQVPPVLLVYPDVPGGGVNLLPAHHPDAVPIESGSAAKWFGGVTSLFLGWEPFGDIEQQYKTAENNRRPMELLLQRTSLSERRGEMRDTLLRLYENAAPPKGFLESLTDLDRQIREVEEQMRELGLTVDTELGR